MHTIGVIGCGRIARGAHFPALSNLEDVRIKYACDLILSKAEEMKETYPAIENITADYKEVLSDPEVEAVFILTPNYAHYTLTMEALKAGKHVFCEKPITVNYALSKEMAEEAKKQGKMLNIGVCNRYHASVELLQKMNAEGKFGKLYHVNAAFRACRSIPGLGGPFTTKAQSGGGVLIDWGVHYLDLILYILGNPGLKTVSCSAYSEMAKDIKSYKFDGMWAQETSDFENGTFDVDDYIVGHVRTEGASISFNGAWAQNLDIDERYIDFLGDKGGARLSYCGQVHLFDGETLTPTDTDHECPDFYTLEDKNFLQSIETGVKDKNNIDNVLESALLLDLLYQSAEKQEEIKL